MSTKLKYFKILNPESKSRNNHITIIEKSEIQKHFIDQGLIMSELRSKYKVSRRVLLNSLEYHKFDKGIIAKVKTRKLIRRNKTKIGGIGWENKSKMIDSIVPAFYENFKELYIEGEYEKSWELLQQLWNNQFKLKIALKSLRASVKSRLKNLDKDIYIGSISNQIEWVVNEIILGLGYKTKPQFKVGKYYYDFLIESKKLIIEVNGSQFHTLENDKVKVDFAKRKGYKVCIIELSKFKKENHVEFIRDKISKAIGVKKSM